MTYLLKSQPYIAASPFCDKQIETIENLEKAGKDIMKTLKNINDLAYPVFTHKLITFKRLSLFL